MTSLDRSLLSGALAGAAGTTALNAVTYLDMAVRGRPASSTPEDSVEKTVHLVGTEIPGDEETRSNRLQGLGPLIGIVVGVGVGAAAAATTAEVPPARLLPLPVKALALATVAMVGANAPMAAMGISDPRSWSVEAWLSDLIPHLAYGAVTATVLEFMTTSERLR